MAALPAGEGQGAQKSEAPREDDHAWFHGVSFKFRRMNWTHPDLAQAAEVFPNGAVPPLPADFFVNVNGACGADQSDKPDVSELADEPVAADPEPSGDADNMEIDS